MTVGTIDQIMPRSHSVNTVRMPLQTLFSEVNGYMSVPTFYPRRVQDRCAKVHRPELQGVIASRSAMHSQMVFSPRESAAISAGNRLLKRLR